MSTTIASRYLWIREIHQTDARGSLVTAVGNDAREQVTVILPPERTPRYGGRLHIEVTIENS